MAFIIGESGSFKLTNEFLKQECEFDFDVFQNGNEIMDLIENKIEISNKITLKDITDRFTNQEKRIYFFKMSHGAIGEQKVIDELKKLSDDYTTINDLKFNVELNDENKIIQFDNVIIGPCGIITIEVKNISPQWKEFNVLKDLGQSKRNMIFLSCIDLIFRKNIVFENVETFDKQLNYVRPWNFVVYTKYDPSVLINTDLSLANQLKGMYRTELTNLDNLILKISNQYKKYIWSNGIKKLVYTKKSIKQVTDILINQQKEIINLEQYNKDSKFVYKERKIIENNKIKEELKKLPSTYKILSKDFLSEHIVIGNNGIFVLHNQYSRGDLVYKQGYYHYIIEHLPSHLITDINVIYHYMKKRKPSSMESSLGFNYTEINKNKILYNYLGRDEIIQFILNNGKKYNDNEVLILYDFFKGIQKNNYLVKQSSS